MDLRLTKIAETTTIITLGWTPPIPCFGYVFYVNDKRVSNTWDPTMNHTRFHKIEGAVYKVVAVEVAAIGVYPPGTPTDSENYGSEDYGAAIYSH